MKYALFAALLSASSPTFAQDTTSVESLEAPKPFYRIEATLKDAVEIPDDGMHDLTVQFFAAPDGEVALAAVAPKRMRADGACSVFLNEKGELCFCSKREPGKIQHVRLIGGAVGTMSIDIVVTPVEAGNGELDFEVTATPVFQQIGKTVQAAGFDAERMTLLENAGALR